MIYERMDELPAIAAFFLLRIPGQHLVLVLFNPLPYPNNPCSIYLSRFPNVTPLVAKDLISLNAAISSCEKDCSCWQTRLGASHEPDVDDVYLMWWGGFP